MKKNLVFLLVLTILTCGGCSSENRQKPKNAANDPWQATFTPGELPIDETRLQPSVARSAYREDVDLESTRVPGDPPASQTLQMQVNHDNGTQLQLSHITFDDTKTTIELLVVNGSGETVMLNGYGKDVWLVDSRGNRYAMVPPVANKTLEVPDGKTMDAALNFAGRMHPQAEYVTLITNDRAGDATNPRTRRPKFVVEIPLENSSKD